MLKECANCMFEYEANTHRQKYCLRILSKNCEICSQELKYICNSKIARTCSRKCSGVLIRREQAEWNVQNCIKCDAEFYGAITNAKYCRQLKSKECAVCFKEFEKECNYLSYETCSESCKFVHMRRTSYNMLEKTCIICNELFTPKSSKSLICYNEHITNCEFCKNEFALKGNGLFDEARGRYCDNTCSTLAQMNSKLPSELAQSYKNADDWAIEFFKINAHKPSFEDFRAFFNVSPGYNVDKSLFNKSAITSKLETEVMKSLSIDFSIETILHKRFKPHELDIYFPTLQRGIEINGEYWHSNKAFERTGNTRKKEIYGSIENYHQAKIDHFGDLAIDIVFVWEYDWGEKPEEVLRDLKKFIQTGVKSELLTRTSSRMDQD